MLRLRFVAARSTAAERASQLGDSALAEKILAFQFKDIRPKAVSEIKELSEASKLLGHSDKKITKKIYRRVGELLKPTR